MRLLLTGANGLLGQKLVSQLHADPEVDLLATARGPARFAEPAAYRHMDITQPGEIEEVFEAFQPEVVIHTAAMTQVDQCQEQPEQCTLLNTTSVGYLLAAAARTGAHFVHLSTDFVFDGSHGPLAEDAEPRPISHYGHSKLESERLVQAYQHPWAIVRTVLVYGLVPDMSRSNIALWVKNSLAAGKEIHVVNDQWRTPTLAEDLAQGCHLVAKQGATGIFHISGEELMTPYDIALATAQHFGLSTATLHQTDGSRFQQAARRPPKTGFIVEKAKRELGYSPHSFAEGLAILEGQLTKWEN